MQNASTRPLTSQAFPQFFCAAPMGRRILAGFSHLQRIHKGTSTNVWFPEKSFSADLHRTEWAAIRQFDILQEADNMQVYDMDVSDLRYSLDNITKMRAGGYRITVITLGDYQQRMAADDLQILDIKLQEEITRMIHFLYLNELSESLNVAQDSALQSDVWSVEENLDHVALTLAAKRLYKPEKETLVEKTFFAILSKLSKRHIIHETGIGLQLPDSTKEKNWVYVAKGENQLWRFQQAISTVFENLDETRATMTHMRGYGDHVGAGYGQWQQQCLHALAS